MAAIQVKTNQGSKKSWILNAKAEKFISKNHFYIFVNLKTQSGLPDFHIVSSNVVAKMTKDSHSKWLQTPGKNGKAHKDTLMRQFQDPGNEYLNKWDQLGL
jgi:hypothetical protein